MSDRNELVLKVLSLIFILLFFSFHSAIPLFAFERVRRNGKYWIRYTTGNTPGDTTDELWPLLLQPLKDEGCFSCQSDLYFDLAYDPNDNE